MRRLPAVRATALLALALFSLTSLLAADDPHLLRLKIATFDPATDPPALPESLRLAAEPASGVFVAQLRAAASPAMLSSIRALGVETLGYLPDDAYLVRVPEGRVPALRLLPGVRWLGVLQPGWKLAPDLGTRAYLDPDRRAGGKLWATADLFDGEDPIAAAAAVRAAGAEVIQIVAFGPYERLKLHATRVELEAAARVPAVSWIEEAAEITERNDTTHWVIQTNVPNLSTVWDHGIHGEGQVVGHIDGNVDMSSCYFRDPANNTPGPGHRKMVGYHSSTGLGADSHGTHTAGTAAGDQTPVTGSAVANGNAFAAKISHSNLNDVNGSGTSPSNLYNYLSLQHDDGARVHTNSWGDDGTTAYTTWCVDIDRYSYDHEDDLVMFAVTNTSTLKTPENAKDCVGVGASQNGTNDANFCSGGRGPTNDGRRKPEVFAPGCSIVSARSNIACSTTSLTGTSMASPAVTAGAALVRQYYAEGWYPSGAKNAADSITPSGALMKATLVNASVDMTGLAGYPSNEEGWGRLLLENALYFSGDARKLAVLDDRRNATGLATGGQSSYTMTVDGATETLRVTMVFTDPPASLLANPAAVNDLNLVVVSPSGTTYLGNVVNTATGLSTTGGSPDPRNNVEQVIVGSPETGAWTVRVDAAAVNQGTQGFAVIASGQVQPPAAQILAIAGRTIQDAPPLGNGDGVADPGETITMPVSLRNASTSPVTGIAGALSSDQPALVKVTDRDALFPDLAAGATASSLAPHYRYTLSPAATCGQTIRFTLDTSSSVGNGEGTFTVPVGRSHIDDPAGGLPLTIPKNNVSGATAAVTVAETFTIANVTVSVDIGHRNVGELVVTLRSPAGTTVTLHNKSHAGTADIVATYDTDRPPDGPGTMNAFDGQNAHGTWTLTAIDDVGGSTPAGQIRGVTLRLDATAPIACTPLNCATPAPGAVADDVALAPENGTDLRLTWSPVASASSYRIWRSALPTFAGEVLVATASGTTLVLAGELASPDGYYEVRAVNTCEWEGP